jgi:serine/threonine protein kinase
MHENVTLLPPAARASDSRGISFSLPPDLLEQVRDRIGVLALIILIAFAFDPMLYVVIWVLAKLLGYPAQFGNLGFRLVDLCAVAASAGLLLVARNRKVSAHRLHWLGLAYEIVICFVIAFVTYWQYYNDKKVLPSLTWVPAVIILFPLVLPGPPRRMLAAAILPLQPCRPWLYWRLPPELDRLILSCLAKNPDERPQSAKELSTRLAHIELPADWTEERAREWWNRHQPDAGRPAVVSAAST